jgi:Mg2+-importing ATPase
MQKSVVQQETHSNEQQKSPDIQEDSSLVTLAILFERLKSSERGLTSDEAEDRFEKFGPNEPTAVRRMAGIRQFLYFLANPLVIILLIASIVSAVLGEVIDSAIIVTMVLLSVAINFIQSYRSQHAVERLRAGVALTATALRDGTWMELPRHGLVPGDIIRLSAGDLVPADARLIQAVDLHAQQSALTGESMPVEKFAQDLTVASENPAEAINMVFLGTSIVSGTATALIVETGRSTAFGDIAIRLTTRPPETEFERGIRRFGLLIMRTVFFLVLFVFLATMISTKVFHHGTYNPLESLLFAVSLAVGLTPEFLPMITTVTLSAGASHMAKQKVIVKNLESIQNFGSMDILCSDKTGTLTSGNMVLNQYLNPIGKASDQVFLYAYLNSFFETGIKSPLDAAILQHNQQDIQGYRKLDEIPFDFERRRLSIVVEKDGKALLITKGAPESILSVCSSSEVAGQIGSFDSQTSSQSETLFHNFSAQGFRMLAVAYRPMSLQEAYTKSDEQDMVFMGFLTFYDPPLEDASEMLKKLRSDGVDLKIITGDNELVTRYVCERVGLNTDHIVLGKELDHMSDTALTHIAEQANVFARVSPAQKNRIILALKRRSHVVGYLGDGINDAPSLHAADVGISVASAVDVAKDAASIIMMDKGLQVLHNGIIEGRKAFGNVMKYLLMGTSSNFGNMFSMAGAALFLPFLPMLPMQILLNNFLYDLSQVTIPTDNVDSTYIIKPHRWDIKLIRDFMIYIGPISSIFDFLTFFIMLQVFHASQELFHTGWFVESLATQTLVLFIIRTVGNPLRSRPSLPLTITTISIVCVGILLPFTPLAGPLGFTPLPALYFLFLAVMVVIYLLLVEVVKRRLMRRLVK